MINIHHKHSYKTSVHVTLAAVVSLLAFILVFNKAFAEPNLSRLSAPAVEATVMEQIIPISINPQEALMPNEVDYFTKRRKPEDYAFVVSFEDKVCLAKTINGEARNQPISGQIKVAEIVLNRLLRGSWGDSICDVVKYKRKGTYHFSMYDPSDPNLEHVEEAFSAEVYSPATLTSLWVADHVLMNGIRYLPDDAYNYATANVDNYWTRKLEFVEQDGDHVFRRGR